MLCQICIGVLEHRTNLVYKSKDGETPWVVYTHHLNTSTLATSAAGGCYVCRPIWNQFSDVEQAALRLEESNIDSDNAWNRENSRRGVGSLTNITLFPEELVPGNYYLDVGFSDDGIDWTRVSAKGKAHAIIFDLEPVARAPPRLYELIHSDNTASEESWSLATNWMSVCLTTHKTCNEGRNSGWYPTRLLDMGETDGAQSSIRLIHSTGASLSGGYCTLSHCWGTHVPFQLNRETAEVLCRGVTNEDLPRTFRDAVVVSRRIGVRYLWIDSLCIMQDETSDWLHEADRMHFVYSNSYCNFSAAASSDSSQGLFRDRQPEMLHPTQVSLCVQDLGFDVAHIPCNVFMSSLWDDNVTNCVVNKRGWVLQERMLAPRILYFGSDQLLWECRECSVCESFPSGLPFVFERNARTAIKRMDPKSVTERWALGGETLDPALANYEIWNLIVRAYSTTSLTVPGDKLVALSGLAKRFMAILDDTYVAGMWRKQLEKSLCWLAIGSDSPTCPPATYRAPTWSWAATDMVISMSTQCDGASQIKVADIVLQHATSDTTGVVTCGWLDLIGQLRPMQLKQQNYGTRKRYYISINGPVISPYRKPSISGNKGMLIYFDTPPQNNDAFQVDNLANTLYYMVCRLPAGGWEYVQMLLLRLVDTEKKLYERLGVATSYSNEQNEILLADIDEEVKQRLPCLGYKNGLHTIRII